MELIKKELYKIIDFMSCSHFYAFIEWNPDPKDFAPLVAKWMKNHLNAELNARKILFEDNPISVLKFRELLWFVYHELISETTAKKVLTEMFDSGDYASQIILEKNLWQISNDSEIIAIIDKIILENQDKAQEYKSGKIKLLGFFVGQVMKASAGNADPVKINILLKEKLDRIA